MRGKGAAGGEHRLGAHAPDFGQLYLVVRAKFLSKDSPAVHDFKRATSKLIAEILLADSTDSSTTQA